MIFIVNTVYSKRCDEFMLLELRYYFECISYDHGKLCVGFSQVITVPSWAECLHKAWILPLSLKVSSNGERLVLTVGDGGRKLFDAKVDSVMFSYFPFSYYESFEIWWCSG